MSRNIKLIWEFRGKDALKTAEHHEIHLGEYAQENQLKHVLGVTVLDENHAMAYLAIEEAFMLKVRDALLPQTAEVFHEELKDQSKKIQ